jgi:hypothetical protein
MLNKAFHYFEHLFLSDEIRLGLLPASHPGFIRKNLLFRAETTDTSHTPVSDCLVGRVVLGGVLIEELLVGLLQRFFTLCMSLLTVIGGDCLHL